MAKEVTIDENKQKALAAAMAQIEKQYGKGSVMKLGDTAHSQSVLIHGLLVQLHLNIILPSAADLYAGHRAYRLQLRHNLIIGQGENVAAVGGA